MEITSLKSLLAWEPPKVEAVIEGGILLPETSLVVYGLWKSGKSMFTQHMAFCISCGLPILGFPTSKSSVLLVQLEIPKTQFRKRVEKYSRTHDLYPSNLSFGHTGYLKLDRDMGKSKLDRALQAIQPDVLIIDPLYKVLSGDVSSSYDMMKLLDNLDDLKSRHHFSLVLVHHAHQPRLDDSGHHVSEGLEGMMGSSYLPDWLDAAIYLRVVGQDIAKVTFDGMRHAEEPLDPVTVRFNRQTLGFSPVTMTQTVAASALVRRQ